MISSNLALLQLTGREHGLSRTTRSSDRWITSMGLDRTGVSCLQLPSGIVICIHGFWFIAWNFTPVYLEGRKIWTHFTFWTEREVRETLPSLGSSLGWNSVFALCLASLQGNPSSHFFHEKISTQRLWLLVAIFVFLEKKPSRWDKKKKLC